MTSNPADGKLVSRSVLSRRHRTAIVALYFALLAAACGDGGGSPTAPTPSQIPNVAGTYTGTTDGFVDNIAIGSFPTQVTVVQSGSRLTITGSVDGPIMWETWTGTIDEAGVFTHDEVGDRATQDCGPRSNHTIMLNFSGNTARGVETYTTDCAHERFEFTLTKL